MAMSCGVGRRCGSDPVLLWLWQRPAAVAPIKPLAWEPPYAVAAALEKAKRPPQKKKKKARLVSMKMQVRSLASLSGLRILRCSGCTVGQAAAAWIPPLAWEPLYAAGAVFKKERGREEERKERK